MPQDKIASVRSKIEYIRNKLDVLEELTVLDDVPEDVNVWDYVTPDGYSRMLEQCRDITETIELARRRIENQLSQRFMALTDEVFDAKLNASIKRIS